MQLHKSFIYFIILFINSAVVVESYKYLFLFPTTAKTHFIVGSALMNALAERGHEIYVISAFPQETPMKNYYDISFESNNLDDLEESSISWISNSLYYPHEADVSEIVLQHPQVQNLLIRNYTFDAVICDYYMSEAFFGFSEHFKAPLILLAAKGPQAWNSDMIGSPLPISHMAESLASPLEYLSFPNRLINLLYVYAVKLDLYFNHLPRQAALYRKYFPHLERDLDAVRKGVAAVLLNNYPPFGSLRPQPRLNHIEVGGMHIRPQCEPLPKDIEDFIEDAEHGVIYFSLDSGTDSSYLSFESYMELLRTFGHLKQRVLWKLDDYNVEGIRDSVYVSNWFPQQDILAHDNVKIFVTHGDWLSIMESIYHAKPIIGIAATGDQFSNVAIMKSLGIGISLKLENLSAVQLLDAVRCITNDKHFAQNVQLMSARYRDQPLPPLDLAVYWAEHVAHYKDGNHMCCADLDLSLMAHESTDLMFTLCVGIYFVLFIMICLLGDLLKHLWWKVPLRIRGIFQYQFAWESEFGEYFEIMQTEPTYEPEEEPEERPEDRPEDRPEEDLEEDPVLTIVPVVPSRKAGKEKKKKKSQANKPKNKKKNK